MNSQARPTQSFTRLVACVAVLFSIGALSYSNAQWQYVYGDQYNQAGRAGVQQTFDGGFVAVGETDTTTGIFDVYVVKTDMAGNLQWSYGYDIGYHDYGKDIQQTKDSGYIVTGYTYDSNNCCTRNNLFLMKLNKIGNVQWLRVYGGNDDEQGWCVREIDSVAGYIVAGRSSSFGQGDYDGLLMRTYSDGRVNWSRVYGDKDVEYFLGCTRVETDTTDHIVAVGSTYSYGNAQEAWMMKVAMSDGVPVWTHVYGTEDNELFRSVRQTAIGHFIIAGYTTAPGSTANGLLVETASNGAILVTKIYTGGGWSEMTDVQEMGNGRLIATGLFNNVPNGYGGYDVYVGHFFPGFNPLAHRVYGGAGNDQGFSIAPAGNNAIVAGLTTSFGNGQQLYLIHTPLFTLECHHEPDLDSVDVSLDSLGIVPLNSLLHAECEADWYMASKPLYEPVCNHGSPAPGRTIENMEGDSSGVSTQAGVEIIGATSEAVTSYPNPVKRGSAFTIAYTVTDVGRTEVMVTNIEGRVIHRSNVRGGSGRIELPMSTEGWAVGTYLVKLPGRERWSE